jgi:hypothetical protein
VTYLTLPAQIVELCAPRRPPIRTKNGYVNLATAQSIVDTGVIDSDGYISTRYRIVDAGGASHNFVALAGRLEAALEINPRLYGFEQDERRRRRRQNERRDHC